MPKNPDPLVTIKVRSSTRKELIRMQGLYQAERGEKVSMDKIIWTFIQSQPKVDLIARPSQEPRRATESK